MDSRAFKQGAFVKAEDIKEKGGRVGATISEVTVMKDEKTGRSKLAIALANSGKKVALNSGNQAVLEDAYGFETDNWVGKSVELHFDPEVRFGGKKVGGIKVVVKK